MAYLRKSQILVGPYDGSMLVICENMRTTFSITRTSKDSQAEISIYNLSEDTRNKITTCKDKQGRQQVILKAGYEDEGDLGLLWYGDVYYVEHVYKQPEWITKIESSSGLVAQKEPVSMAWAKDVSGKALMEYMVKLFKLTIDKKTMDAAIKAVNADKIKWVQGFSCNCTVGDGLTLIAKRLLLEWSVQNQTLRVTKVGSDDGSDSYDLSAVLVGSPERTRQQRKSEAGDAGPLYGWRVRCLLCPKILPRARIRIPDSSKVKNVDLIVEKVVHSGDTHGGAWDTTIESKDM